MTFFDDLTTRPPSGRSPRRRENSGRARALAVALVTAAVVVTIAAVFLMAAMFPGLRFTSAAPARVVPTSAPPPKPVPSFTPAPSAPAAKVVKAMLATAPAGLPAGVSDASSVSGTVAPALNLACGQPVGPVLSQQRSWALPAGPMGSGLTLTVSAYSAGAGAAALDAMREATRECAKGAAISPREGLGIEALDVSDRVGSRQISSVVFRRGDVLVSVSGAGAAPSPTLLGHLDTRLDGLLGAPGVCADQRADVAAFARSVVSGPKTYSGLEVQRPVPLPTGSGTSLPPIVSPSPVQPLPAPQTATTPAEPYWPTSAPAPVPSPTAPTAPSPYPTQTAVPVPQEDRTGPGCGWAFTGMRAPSFDEQAAERTAQERMAAAVAAMQAAVAAYPGQAGAYAAAWAEYERQAADYAETNARIAEVEAAWAIIRQQQEAYATALTQYQKELADFTSYEQRRADAMATYQQQLAECATQAPTPVPLPPGTVPPVPPAPPGPTPGPTPTATTPTSTTPTPAVDPGGLPGAPAPFAAAPVTCPPVPDPILTEPAPTSPYSPLPPPDPRPTPGGAP